MTKDQYVDIARALGVAAVTLGRTRLPGGDPLLSVLIDQVPLTDGPLSTTVPNMRRAWYEGFDEAMAKWEER